MAIRLFATIALISAGICPSPLVASEDADSKSDAALKIAAHIRETLKPQGVQAIFIRDFRSFGSSDVGIKQLLVTALQNDFEIRPDAGYEIEGRFRPIPPGDRDKVDGYKVDTKIVTPEEFQNFPDHFVTVFNDREAHEILGETGAKRPQPITLGKPPIELPAASNGPLLVGGRLYAAEGSPYSIEILVGQAGPNGSRPTHFETRLPQIDGRNVNISLERGEFYIIRVHNDSGYEAFASLNVDGVGRFAINRDPAKKSNVDLLAPASARELKGFALDEAEVSTFMVGNYEDSVAKRVLGEAPDVGTITVAFGVSWPRSAIIADWEREQKRVVYEDTVIKHRTEERTSTYTSDGGAERTRTYTVEIAYPETVQTSKQVVVATVEGPAAPDATETVLRDFGLTRAIIKVRYYATK